MRIKNLFMLLTFVFSLLLVNVVHAEEQYITFNGNFQQGTTLYSNWYNNIKVFAKDSYPIRGEIYCEEVTQCKTWHYDYKSYCIRWNKYGICKSYKIFKIINGCEEYETVTKCKNTRSYGAKCPTTNQLSLKGNFFYTTDGINWLQMNYRDTNFIGQVKFKVVIPSVCKPNYDINHNILIL